MIGIIMSPCKDCAKRYLGCHDRCDDYGAYKVELEDIRLKIMKFHSQDGYFKEAKVKSILRGMGKRA